MVTTSVDVPADFQPGELAARLRKAGLSEIDTSTRRRAEYSSDASNYRVVPLVVAFPRSADDMIAALDVCRELGVPLAGRGAGTSIAGNALSAGLVLDTSRHLNRVLSVDPERRTAVVEPGAVLDSVTAAAAPYGLRFGPDPSTHSRATIGGAIGNNACGSRALRYGRSADNVVALDVLTGTGAAVHRRPVRQGRARRAAPARPRCSRACAPWSAATWPRSGPSSAGSPGRCPATRWSTCCRRTSSTWPSSSRGPRGAWH